MKKIATVSFYLRLLCLGVVMMGVNGLMAQPSANFSASEVYVCAGSSVAFTNLSTGSNSATWFENGVIFSTQNNPNRVFSIPGAYTITLIASNGGQADTASTLLQVVPGASSAFNVNDPSCFGFTDGDIDLTVTGGTPKRSLCFDGVNDFVAANGVGQENFGGGMTIEAWVKPDAGWTSGDGMIAAVNTSTGGNQLLFSYNTSLQKFIYFDGTVGNQIQNGVIAPRGQWHHVAITLSSANAGRMYVNGTLVRTFVTGTSWVPNNSLFSLGQEYDGLSTTSQHFFGCIGDLRVWNTALTAQTINSNFTSICAAVPPNHPNINSLVAYYSFNEGVGSFVFDRSGNDNHGTYNGNQWGSPADTDYGCFSEGTGYVYNWNIGASTEDLANLGSGTYAVTFTDGANCTLSDSVTLTDPPEVIFTVAATPSDTLCLGDTVDLVTTGSYTFSYSPNGSLSDSTGATVQANPTATTTYTVIASDLSNCQDTSTIELVVNALPTPSISGDDTLCVGDTTTLVATGGVGFQWSTGDVSGTIQTSPAVDSTYQVLVTDSNGCQETASYEVTVNALPLVAISQPAPICVGDSADITASGGSAYVWSTNDSTATITVAPAASASYSVVVTDSNGCQSGDSVSLQVNDLPTISFGGDQAICLGDTASISASGGDDYSWNTGDSTAMIMVAPSVSTDYSVAVTDSNGCMDSDTVSLAVNSLPTVSIAAGDTVCAGDTAQLDASGADSYLWSTGDASASVQVAPMMTTDYLVTGTDTNGCEGSDTASVVVNALPSLSFSGDQGVCPGSPNMIMVSGANSYSWNTGDTTDTVMNNLAATFTYVVTGTDGNGCSATDSSTVVVFAPPVAPTITQVGANLVASPGYATYQWLLAGSAIAGATDSIYQPTTSGSYSVVVTDTNGCEATSAAGDIVGQANAADLGALSIYPNPNQGQFVLEMDLATGRSLDVRVVSIVGQVLYERTHNAPAGRWTTEIGLQNVAPGVYLVEVRTEQGRSVRKLIVE